MKRLLFLVLALLAMAAPMASVASADDSTTHSTGEIQAP
jgi:Ni/Co efflux regulator RcnB